MVHLTGKEDDPELVARSRSALAELAYLGGGDQGSPLKKHKAPSGGRRSRTQSGGEAVALGETVGAGSATVTATEYGTEGAQGQSEQQTASASGLISIFQVGIIL